MTLLTALFRQMACLGVARVRSGLADLALLLAIGLCLVVAAGFGLSALHGVLRPVVGAVGASALLAAGLVIVALGLALWLSVRRNRMARVAVLAVPQPGVLAQAADSDVAPDLGSSAAFLAGFLLARRLF